MIIGNGNVAVDVARILLSDPEDLACTNIADHALKTLRTSKVREVVLLGRRGPEQAAFTRPEFLALQHLPGVRVVVDEHPEVRAAIAGAGAREQSSGRQPLVGRSPADRELLAAGGRRWGPALVHASTDATTISLWRPEPEPRIIPQQNQPAVPPGDEKSLPRGVPCATAGHVPSDGHHQHGHSPADDTVAQVLPGDAPGLLGP